MSSFIYVALLTTSLVHPLCRIRTPLAGPGPGPDRTIVLATATAEVLPVPIPDGPEYRKARPDGAAVVTAYRFRVLQSAGGAVQLEPGDSFLVVPWAYDESCDRQIWEDEEWVPAGAEVIFSFSDVRSSAGDELIIDVLGWHSP
ncbi:MAG TPA: hypothetical protein VMN39_06080, partial [Longimicrobiaceae bacterium]|nr:hypothetical protein [Longimicrobiaceae bacterium]